MISGKRTTLYDIATKANVSPMTVSRALRPGPKKEISQATIARIQKIATEMNYHPHTSARSLILRKTLNIGFCVNTPTFSYYTPLLLPLLKSLQNELQSHGYSLGYYFFDNEQDPAFLEFLDNQHVADAIIVFGRNLTEAQRQKIIEKRIRAISLYETHSGLYSIIEDELSAGRLAADYLWTKGHREITLMSRWSGSSKKISWNGRLVGFLQRSAELKMKIEKLEGYWISSPDFPHIWNAGHAAPDMLDKILSFGKAGRCVFTTSDMFALALLRQMDERGLILAKDLSILAFDNMEGEAPQKYPNPRLTTFHRPRVEIGKLIARLAIGAEEGDVDTPFIFPLSIIERGSVAQL